MVFSMFTTRLLATNSLLASPALRLVPAATPRSFSTSRIALCPAAAAKKASKPAGEGSNEPKATVKKIKEKTSITKVKTKKSPGGVEKKEKKEKEAKPKALRISAADKPPKKPIASWGRFLTKFVEDNKTADSSANVAEYAKNASAVWNAMSKHEKAPFEEAYRKEWEEYQIKFQEYSKVADPSIIKELNARREKKGIRKIRLTRDPAEKRPLNGFMRYVNAKRETSGISFANIKEASQFAREAGVEWRAMSDAEKQVYTDAAGKNLKEWQERHKKASNEAST